VHSLDNIPEGMIGQAFEGGDYVPFVSKGDLINGALYDSWLEIWKANLDRKYTVDFEVHGIKAMNPNDGEVEIFVAVK
jgi:predicted transcriptional regulator YdeE